ncbi:MAG: hypothetical protein WC358_10900 [Ignavibacteria bacterium]|jgi:hypothetical protein
MFNWLKKIFPRKNDKCDADYVGMSYSSTRSIDVKGFLRDYRLLSKIKPEHFISGGNSDANIVFTSDPISYDSNSGSPVINPIINTTNGPRRIYGTVNVGNGEVHSGDKSQDPNVPDTTFIVSPKEVFDELETIPCPAKMENLDNKIETYKRMLAIIRLDSSMGNRQTILDLIERLENRKKYRDNNKYETFFSKFKNTSDELINKLLDEHTHLKIGPADDFIPEFPIDAHTTMLEYADMVFDMCGKLPCFYIIAKANEFKTKEGERKKRDPILLVQSPIGMYWQILGAWDEEMELVNDL